MKSTRETAVITLGVGPLASKITRDGYYWPTLMADSLEYFSVGDLVLRVFKASKPKKRDKLNPKWEGPHRVKQVIGSGTYELEELSGKVIKHTWHEIYLKKYYA
ncbi:hypothetical protein LIER_26995 [Lithospermum erythrorhizon]|uniref:Uncharacterized protein n=1 Tax=Lithospermum erythrorhizon TaxID=34254 RepID=A0AAV3RCF7_LITER